MHSFDSYCAAMSRLRSDSIYALRKLGFNGRQRNFFNNLLHRYAVPKLVAYFYYKDNRCKLCWVAIFKLKEATIDHIVPSGVGGENSPKNKQIAHAHCNVLKSNRKINSLFNLQELQH